MRIIGGLSLIGAIFCLMGACSLIGAKIPNYCDKDPSLAEALGQNCLKTSDQ